MDNITRGSYRSDQTKMTPPKGDNASRELYHLNRSPMSSIVQGSIEIVQINGIRSRFHQAEDKRIKFTRHSDNARKRIAT